jgi:formylglycine-generating enzyme required for sulfatase activity
VDTAVTDGSSANDAAIFDGAAASDSDGGTGDGGAPTVLGTWVLIDVSGTPFTMGSPLTELGRFNDEVEHDVTLTRNYWLMATEITQQQYRDVMDYAPSNFSACGMDCPVERVSWHEVAAYANALSALEGLGECYSCTGTAPATIDCSPSGSYPTSYDCPGYRLPTEAEWEYAARGGTTTATYKGELTSVECDDTTLDPIAWFCGNANDTTHPAGTKEANGYGLYDMLGNVWEWCHNWYVRDGDDLELDPSGPASGNQRVIRGGAWDEKARRVRTAVRRRQGAGDRFPDVGGRLARSSP